MEGVAGEGARSDPEAAQHQRQLILQALTLLRHARACRTSVRFIENGCNRGLSINLESTKTSIRRAFTAAAAGKMDRLGLGLIAAKYLVHVFGAKITRTGHSR